MADLVKHPSVALMFLLLGLTAAADTGSRDAKDIVRDALNHWRGTSSQGVMTMTIHRPDWERSIRVSMDAIRNRPK